ncbi:MAG: hypothetical protein WAU62_02000 [Dehalococcoidales bacterium]|jgi:hypothetical protein
MKNLRATEIFLILLDLILALTVNLCCVISSLAYNKGDFHTFWITTIAYLIAGTGCGIISWWAWFKLRTRQTQ